MEVERDRDMERQKERETDRQTDKIGHCPMDRVADKERESKNG